MIFIFGSSSVKGFATMLMISIFVSFLTAVFGTRLLLGFWVDSGFLTKRKTWLAVKESEIKDITSSSQEEPKLFNRNINVVKHRKKFFIFSAITVIIGIVSFIVFQINPGIDFTS
ncbi:hypothetical protein BLX88_00235 [Bacillus obstructivus]|nr:hypothetical protein BLX88_00235 [Bacillus obstructivus]